MKMEVPSYELETIKRILGSFGFNTARYKDSFLRRRIEAALRRSTAQSYVEYLELLKKNPEEFLRLKTFFSINVTRFFRNLDTFEQLERRYLPQLIAQKKKVGNNFAIKVWSVGCSNGAEPYSLAILFSKVLGTSLAQNTVKIIGTDNNPEILSFAKKGTYPESSLVEVPPPIIKHNFTKIAPDLYQINPQLQRMVQFQAHDLLNDSPFVHQDLIICRNVLIYFSRQSQSKLYDEFLRALNMYGLLILGRTEILPMHYRSDFTILDKRHRVYQKTLRDGRS